MNQSDSHNENIDELEGQINKEAEELKQCLEKANLMGSNIEIVKYQNFWCRATLLKAILYFQRHFKAQNSDIIIASQPKNGTTWLKSLLYTMVNRDNPDHQPLLKKSPLLSHNPHELVYYLEYGVYDGHLPNLNPKQLQQLPSPRLLQTHLAYPSLPESIKTSSCKIIYIARNPFDTFSSLWHWNAKLIKILLGGVEFQPPSIEDFFEEFCQGRFTCGPYFDHILGYWNQSLQNPNKVLFLKYEDLKGDHAVLHLKKLAEFVGSPFSEREENEGVIHDIIQLCSINNLKELEVNKTGFTFNNIENTNFFRKGEVGDWTNYFTPSMVEKLNKLMQENFGGTGMSFPLH